MPVMGEKPTSAPEVSGGSGRINWIEEALRPVWAYLLIWSCLGFRDQVGEDNHRGNEGERQEHEACIVERRIELRTASGGRGSVYRQRSETGFDYGKDVRTK